MAANMGALEACIRIAEAKRHLSEAANALSGQEPDWERARVLLDMAGDVMPYIPREGDAE